MPLPLGRFHFEQARRIRMPFSLPDFFVILVVAGFLAGLGFLRGDSPTTVRGAQEFQLSLDPTNLFGLALRSIFRMFAGLFASLVFAIVVGSLAARVKPLERPTLSALDILQSVPVLGFISAAASWFLGFTPNSTLGLELLSIFTVFSSQAWNMTFAYYLALKHQPSELVEAMDSFGIHGIRRLVRLDLPSAAIPLTWNSMISFGGGWFFVAYSELIKVDGTNYVLPGLGSYLDQAIRHENMTALGWAVLAMAIVLVATDQLFWRPLIAWSERFRSDRSTSSTGSTHSWFYELLQQSKLARRFGRSAEKATRAFIEWCAGFWGTPADRPTKQATQEKSHRLIWIALTALTALGAFAIYNRYLTSRVSIDDVTQVLRYAGLTYLRVLAVVLAATIIWVPIGVWIGLNRKAASAALPVVLVLSAFPANFLFPVITTTLLATGISLNFGSLGLLILGSQWYILFNTIAGASAIPTELREVSASLGMTTWQKWKRLYGPAIFPSWVAGAIAASGGAWNASIACEYVEWGDTLLKADGLGAYIQEMTRTGQHGKLVLGVIVMAALVVVINRVVWQRLGDFAESRFKLR